MHWQPARAGGQAMPDCNRQCQNSAHKIIAFLKTKVKWQKKNKPQKNNKTKPPTTPNQLKPKLTQSQPHYTLKSNQLTSSRVQGTSGRSRVHKHPQSYMPTKHKRQIPTDMVKTKQNPKCCRVQWPTAWLTMKTSIFTKIFTCSFSLQDILLLKLCYCYIATKCCIQ